MRAKYGWQIFRGAAGGHLQLHAAPTFCWSKQRDSYTFLDNIMMEYVLDLAGRKLGL